MILTAFRRFCATGHKLGLVNNNSNNLLSTGSEFQVKFPHTYSLSEEENILDSLNQIDLENQGRFSITGSRCKKLMLHRKKYGSFKSLNDVLRVEGFSVKILKSLCDSILNPASEEKLTLKKIRNFNLVSPELTAERLESVKHVVGISLGTLSVSWAGIDVEQKNVFSWGYHALKLSPEVKRHHETQILEAAYDVQTQIPEADTYVMESSVTSNIAQQPSNVPVNQQRLQLSSMLLVLLNQNAKDLGKDQCVVYQRNALWCRLYGTLIGSERVSAQNVVEDLLGGGPGPYTPLDIDNILIENYYSNPPVTREAMCAALLLTSSFVDLNMRKLPECLTLIKGRAKK